MNEPTIDWIPTFDVKLRMASVTDAVRPTSGLAEAVCTLDAEVVLPLAPDVEGGGARRSRSIRASILLMRAAIAGESNLFPN